MKGIELYVYLEFIRQASWGGGLGCGFWGLLLVLGLGVGRVVMGIRRGEGRDGVGGGFLWRRKDGFYCGGNW